MKYFNDIRYEDIKYNKPNNISSISQYFDGWQNEYYESLNGLTERLIEE